MGRTWVPVVGVVAGLIFVLTQLTGSNIDEQAARTLYTALYLLLFTILATAGVALARLQPRYALLGVVATILPLLAFGAFVVSIWSNEFLWFGFGFSGNASARVAWITLLLAFFTSATSTLIVLTKRADESNDVRLARLAGIGALAFLVGLSVLALVEVVEVSVRPFAIAATVYVVASAIALTLHLLPSPDDSESHSTHGGDGARGAVS